MMEHCRFCQADLEPGTQCCSQCGNIQPAPLTGAPTRPGAITSLLSLAALPQDKLPNTRADIVSVPGKGSIPPDAHETIQPGAAIGAIEVLTRQCLFCQKVFPAQGHFCPACGHPVGQLAALSKVNNAQAVTFTVA